MKLNEKNKIISYSEPEDHINQIAKLIIKKQISKILRF